MADLTPFVAALAGAVGYALGRVRPLRRAREWARWNLTGFGRQTTPATLAAILLLPEDWPRLWKHRNDPPPVRMPAPKLGEKWQTILDERSNRDA